MPGKRGGTGLRQGIDNEVYTIVLKLLDDSSLEATVPSLYQAIQKSNSSLRRKPKKVIEDSLERVLDALAEDGQDSEAELQASHDHVHKVDTTNLMNKSLTKAWSNGKDSINASGTPHQTNGTTTAQTRTEPQKKRKREAEPEKKARPTAPTGTGFDDLGGIDDVIVQLEDVFILPLLKPDVYFRSGVPLPRGVLLHGPPGCGKSHLARACAAEVGVPLVEILGPSIVSGMSGESEKQIRDAFQEAKEAAPCILFIDEIDVISPKRESSQSQMEKRIVAQLLISMDSLDQERGGDDFKPVIVLAATNRPDSLDPALRRGGRFDMEISMGVPNATTRAQILKSLTRKSPIADDVDFAALARMTAGFVGADLRDLVTKVGAFCLQQYKNALISQAMSDPAGAEMDLDEKPAPVASKSMDIISPAARPTAAVLALPHISSAARSAASSFRALTNRIRDTSLPEPEGYASLSMPMSAFTAVLPNITPSSKREGFTTVPDTTWSDIGALANVRSVLSTLVVDAVLRPDRCEALGISRSAGVLLWGPPGCGKTLIAKAVANESQANFISVKGPELFNKFVGESERAIRTLFNRARSSLPCVIFFDEIDSLVPRRDANSSEATTRVVNTILTELDGQNPRADIHVIAATNRPDLIDEAILRPGRLSSLLYVGLPGPAERADIMHALLRVRRVASIGDIWPAHDEVARLVSSERCEGFSGADLKALVTESALRVFRGLAERVEIADMEEALASVRPSVTNMAVYDELRKTIGAKGGRL